MPAGVPGAPMGRRSTRILLVAVVVLALALRLLFLREQATFRRVDEPMQLLGAMRLDGLVAAGGVGEFAREAFFALSWPWGYPIIVFIFSFLELYRWLGIPVNELSTNVPFVLLGGAGVVLGYAVAGRVFSRGVALAVAAALAVLPSHVASSRTIGHWVFTTNLMMLTVYLLLRYLDRRRPADAWLFGAALALYVPSDLLAPGTLLLLVLAVIARAEGRGGDRLRSAARVFLRKEVLLPPALSVLPLVVVQLVFLAYGKTTYGYLGHYFVGNVGWSFNGALFVVSLWANGGPGIFLLMVVGALRGARALWQGTRERLFALWFLCFAVPSVLLINPTVTPFRGYLMPATIPLVVLGCAALLEPWGPAGRGVAALARRAGGVGLGLLLAWSAALIPAKVYARPLGPFLASPWGMVGSEALTNTNDGVKTTGYWIRRNSRPDTVVLTDRPPLVARYYFHRPIVDALDPRFAGERLEPLRERIAIVAVTAAFRERAERDGHLRGYHLVATVTHRGQPVFHVFARHPGRGEVLRTEDYDARFDHEFGDLPSLRYPVVWGDDVPPRDDRGR